MQSVIGFNETQFHEVRSCITKIFIAPVTVKYMVTANILYQSVSLRYFEVLLSQHGFQMKDF